MKRDEKEKLQWKVNFSSMFAPLDADFIVKDIKPFPVFAITLAFYE